MPKRVQIQDVDQLGLFIIGLASNAKIWKVCFDLNQYLNLSLAAVDAEPLDPASQPQKGSLFEEHPIPDYHQPVGQTYQDVDSHSHQEFRMIELQKSSLPKEVRSFAYFLFIRFDRQFPPSMEKLLASISESREILSAVDCTHLHQLKLHWL